MNERWGAYGMHLPTLPGRQWLQPVPDHWPTWTHSLDEQAHEVPPFHVGEHNATLPLLSGNSLEVDRDAQRIRYRSTAQPSPAAWIHPILSPAAMFVGDWSGRLAFHAGAFLDGAGRAWVVFGNRGDGKSTALAWLSMHGVTVLCDDLVITDGLTIVTGPRCVDLRTEAAHRLGVGEQVEASQSRERWRIGLPEVSPETPLAGFIQLAWASGGTSTTVAMVEEMANRRHLLTGARALFASQQHPRAWLEVIAKPIVRFERPKSWIGLSNAMAHLIEFTDGHASPR